MKTELTLVCFVWWVEPSYTPVCFVNMLGQTLGAKQKHVYRFHLLPPPGLFRVPCRRFLLLFFDPCVMRSFAVIPTFRVRDDFVRVV